MKELKGFQRIRLKPGEQKVVSFQVHTDELAFFGANMQRRTEPGQFHVWIGPNADTQLYAVLELVE